MVAAEKKKTTLFLCKCGTNIANFINLEEMDQWAKENPDIGAVATHNLLCSPDGKKFFSETLAGSRPERIVIAACSPKLHEKTFQDLAEGEKINRANVQMANIREHCAWVTKDKSKATEKAKKLIAAATKRTWLAENLEKREMEVSPDLLIIGGGIAGIEAALAASKAGRKVCIVEKEISLGGSIIKTEEVAPSMECSPCLLAPRLSAIRDDKNILVITNAQVTQVVGFYGNFTVKILRKARFIEPNCIGCEACFETCPVEVENDFHLGMGKRKAIYTLFPGSVPAAAIIDSKNCKHFAGDSCNACKEACSFNSINFDQKDEEVSMNVGSIIVATGYGSVEPTALASLGYKSVDNVFTIEEFERLASSNGPTGGNIKLKDGSVPSSLAVIHCAGSLHSKGIPYCSGICCMVASKVGELSRKKIPGLRVTNIHHDLVFQGPESHNFYHRQIEEGTRFIKSDDLSSIEIRPDKKGVRITGKGLQSINADMVVLVTGLKPATGSENLAQMLGVELTQSGYYKPDHASLHITGASLDGIYVAGCAGGPCDVPTAVTRSQACIGDALSKLIPGRKIMLESMISVIDDKKCGGCKLCITVCPYKAITYDTEKNISIVNEAICRGCGTCTATCPSGASKAKHFTDLQLYAEIGGLIHG
jgi:heterodisulfide reductase subunit A